MGDSMLLRDAIRDFCTDQEFLGRAFLTRKRHRVELGLLARWLETEKLDWQTLTRAELKRYLRSRAGLSASGRANMLSSFRVFFSWAVEGELIPKSPAVGLRTPSRPARLPRALTRAQIEQLLTHLGSCEGRTAHRNAILTLTLLYAGLRSCEAAGLRWLAIDLDARLLNIELSKMNKGRSVPLHPALVAELERWRAEQLQESAGGYVFTLGEKPISSARVGKIMRKLSKNCKVKFTAHVLRHSFATWALRHSHDLYAVSKALGHSQLAQTEIYLSADVEQVRAALDQLPGLDLWR